MGETVFVLPKLLTLANPDPYSDGGSSPWLAVTVVGWSSDCRKTLYSSVYIVRRMVFQLASSSVDQLSPVRLFKFLISTYLDVIGAR